MIILKDEDCTIEQERAHEWRLIDKLYPKDVYVWGRCLYCECVRLFKYAMPRKRDKLYATTFNEIDGVITNVVETNGESFFEAEIRRRKEAELRYFKRDKEVLSREWFL